MAPDRRRIAFRRLFRSVRARARYPAETAAVLKWAERFETEAPLPFPDSVPPAARRYLETCVRRAHTLTDDDVRALLHAGLSEDMIYELTVAAAVGAGRNRLRRGLAAIAARYEDAATDA